MSWRPSSRHPRCTPQDPRRIACTTGSGSTYGTPPRHHRYARHAQTVAQATHRGQVDLACKKSHRPTWTDEGDQGTDRDNGHEQSRLESVPHLRQAEEGRPPGLHISTVSIRLKENRIPPAPQRPSSWPSFIQAHWGKVVATDFFSVELWTPQGLKSNHVLFFVSARRQIHVRR
ncbi:MAG: hypothetical protein ACI8X5_002655 [Planctomycetota bacterium]